MRERPLHYAALAGSSQAVQVLLRANADPMVRSAFLETPLDVARENAAAYLNVDTEPRIAERVVQLLSSAEALERQLAMPVVPVNQVGETARIGPGGHGLLLEHVRGSGWQPLIWAADDVAELVGKSTWEIAGTVQDAPGWSRVSQIDSSIIQ
eukprot:Skav230023  [mRNA]  locus=scaffold769:401108:405961:- [translate_table: standard]